MARNGRREVFAPDEIAVVHVMNRVVRRCFLMGDDPLTGNNYDHRKDWMEKELERVAAFFGIDLLTFAILSNHFHLILRSRPDVVASWDAREVARRWLMLCPKRKDKDGSPLEPTEPELNSIASDESKLRKIRSRLSDISWWMRLTCQRIAKRANREDGETGKFWQSRYKAVRLIDEESILACSAYVDLNPVRAALAQSLEGSSHTSVQRRLEASRAEMTLEARDQKRADAFLAPLEIDELSDPLGLQLSVTRWRLSDKGYLPMSLAAYTELLEWTAHRVTPETRGAVQGDCAPAVLERIGLKPGVWCELVRQFGRLFSVVAGQPHHVDSFRSRERRRRYHLRQAARDLLHA